MFRVTLGRLRGVMRRMVQVSLCRARGARLLRGLLPRVVLGGPAMMSSGVVVVLCCLVVVLGCLLRSGCSFQALASWADKH